MRRGLDRLLRRFVVLLGGEVAQSAFHFGLNLALVRGLSPHDYGRFAILFLVGGLALTYVRSLAGVPAGIFLPGRVGRRAAHGYDVAFGSAALLLSAAIGLGVSAVLSAVSDIGAAAGGLFVALWTLRSYVRIVLFAKQRAGAAGLGDLAFALSGAALVAAFMHGDGRARLDGTLTALACAHAFGIVVSLAVLRQPVRISFGRSVRRRYRALLPSLAWSLVGVTTANIQGQGQSLLVALVAGPSAYAPIAATVVLFSPARLSASALINMAQPEIARNLARGDGPGARRVALACAGLLALGCLVYGALVLAALPAIETRLFAGQFSGEPMTLIAASVWAIVTVSLVHAPLRVLLETVQEFRALARLAGASAAIGGIAVAGLLLTAAPAWSLLGVLLAEIVVLATCCRILAPWRPDGPLPGAAAPRDLSAGAA